MSNWPMLKHYDRDHLARVAMPIGGIGTGTVSLGGRGLFSPRGRVERSRPPRLRRLEQ